MSLARILVVDDEPEIRSAVGEILSDEGYEIALAESANEARLEVAAKRPDLVLLDVWMEGEDGISLLREWSENPELGLSVLMMSGHGTVDTAIEATRLGALDFMEKPISLAKLLYAVERALKAVPRRHTPLASASLLDIIGAHPRIAALKSALESIVGRDESVMIVGETGSGRETLARRLARLEHRGFEPFMLTDADPAALRTGLAAIRRVQSPRLLFFDELSDALPAAQEVLIAFLNENREARLRFSASIQAQAIADARVRRDLYDRLGVLVIEVPALREYRDFIPEIIRHYVETLADHEGYTFRQFGVAALNRLRRHDWPGNLQELGNVIRRLLADGNQGTVEIEEVDAAFAANLPRTPQVGEDLLSLP
ncbi:MAG: sigma-54-dependent transcriptional regulator, partial [Gammaproteobacteria bacterium]